MKLIRVLSNAEKGRYFVDQNGDLFLSEVNGESARFMTPLEEFIFCSLLDECLSKDKILEKTNASLRAIEECLASLRHNNAIIPARKGQRGKMVFTAVANHARLFELGYASPYSVLSILKVSGEIPLRTLAQKLGAKPQTVWGWVRLLELQNKVSCSLVKGVGRSHTSVLFVRLKE